MSYYPRQDFIYGIGVSDEFYKVFDEEEYNQIEELVEDFCGTLGLTYSFGGDRSGDNNTGLVIGIKINTITDSGYLGGYWVTGFDMESFNKSYEEAKKTLTQQQINYINEFMGINEKPKLWTISWAG